MDGYGLASLLPVAVVIALVRTPLGEITSTGGIEQRFR